MSLWLTPESCKLLVAQAFQPGLTRVRPGQYFY
jgi:hypothetical protein